MKRLLIIFILMSSIVAIKAQSTVIHYTGEDAYGNYARIDSVIIINVTRSWTKTIYFPDTSIDLFYVGVPSYSSQSDKLILSQNTPNPCSGVTNFNLYLPEKDNITIELSDILGRKVQSFQQTLEAGTHSFNVSLNAPQVYFLTAKTKSGIASIKIINTNENNQNVAINYSNSISSSTKIQKQTQEFFLRGDSMIYIGYSAQESQSVSRIQNDNETIRFTFGLFVDKTIQNRNVLLEDYVGINSGYSTEGHRVADLLYAKYPDKVFLINTYAGQYSGGIYNITEGTVLHDAFGVSSYPLGVINRELVVIGGTAKYTFPRNYWESISSQLMAKSAYVNVASKSTINKNTRELTCKVQGYFTDDSEVGEGKNFINIIIVQDSIMGAQSSGSSYLEMWNDTIHKYQHNHILRAIITGVSGEAIPTNTKGTLYSKTFTYIIPETISNEAMVLEKLSIIVFVSQNDPLEALTVTQPDQVPRVINVCKASLTFK